MVEEDEEKTIFIANRGIFYYKVMLFGLKNARVTYQRLVNRIFVDQLGRNMEVYVDDMLVKSKTMSQHIADLKETFFTLRKHGMRLNPTKCAFGVNLRKFLRFIISHREIEANLEKIRAILELSPLKTIKEVQSLAKKVAALSHFVSRSAE